jgi:hypothetical protein
LLFCLRWFRNKQEMLARQGLFGVKRLSIFVYVRPGAFLKGRDFYDWIAPQT